MVKEFYPVLGVKLVEFSFSPVDVTFYKFYEKLMTGKWNFSPKTNDDYTTFLYLLISFLIVIYFSKMDIFLQENV